MRPLAPLLLLLGACAPEDDTAVDPWSAWFVDDETVLEGSHANVVQEFLFLAADDNDRVEGFDLDGVDDTVATASCGLGDSLDPWGATGIDNQFGQMWGLIEGLVGEQVQQLLQGSINEGRFLFLVELAGVDDLSNDDDVSILLSRGQGEPWIGGQGLIAPDQTYRIDPSIDTSRVDGVAIVDGVLAAGPVDFTLPIDILEVSFPMHVRDGQIRLEIAPDGTFSGMLGGYVDVDFAINELLQSDAAEEAAAVEPFFRNNADAFGDGGECTFMSAAFGFEGTTAFVVHPAPTDPDDPDAAKGD